MSVRLVLPQEAGVRVADAITKRWAAAVCAEVAGGEPFRVTVRLRPGVRASSDVANLGFDRWHEWAQSWHDVAAGRPPGVEVAASRIVVERVPDQVAAELVVTGLDAARALVGQVGTAAPDVDLDRARTIVVEGGGKAAASLLSDVPWVRHAQNVVYWGDIDADGFAILDHFRRTLAAPGDGAPGRDVASILMDAMAAQRYAHLGVSTDKDGRPIPPSSTHLPHLGAAETAAYHAVATAGPAKFRRIEQERLPEDDARAALSMLLQA